MNTPEKRPGFVSLALLAFLAIFMSLLVPRAPLLMPFLALLAFLDGLDRL
jgi:hypothetical protein